MSVSHVQTVNNLIPIKSGYSSVTITGVTVGNLLVVTAQSTLAGSVTGVGDTFNSYQSAQGEQVSANGNTTRQLKQRRQIVKDAAAGLQFHGPDPRGLLLQ